MFGDLEILLFGLDFKFELVLKPSDISLFLSLFVEMSCLIKLDFVEVVGIEIGFEERVKGVSQVVVGSGVTSAPTKPLATPTRASNSSTLPPSPLFPFCRLMFT